MQPTSFSLTPPVSDVLYSASMSKLTRHYQPGQLVFITSVTARRRPLLVHNAKLLIRATRRAMKRADFKIVAWVIMPDHFHLILDAPNGDTSSIMHSIKLSFSGQYRSLTGQAGSVWQRQYWDHIIRSQDDMNKHIDYIHFNPVKHGLVESPRDYGLSSFRRFCRQGQYDWNWRAERRDFEDREFGE